MRKAALCEMKKEELPRAIVDKVGKRKTADCATSCMVGRALPDIVIWFPGIARSTRYVGWVVNSAVGRASPGDQKNNVGRSPTYRLCAHPPENQFGLTCRNATEIVDVKDRPRLLTPAKTRTRPGI
jgi:hypothetical protein